jgi:hypothetical protein
MGVRDQFRRRAGLARRDAARRYATQAATDLELAPLWLAEFAANGNKIGPRPEAAPDLGDNRVSTDWRFVAERSSIRCQAGRRCGCGATTR